MIRKIFKSGHLEYPFHFRNPIRHRASLMAKDLYAETTGSDRRAIPGIPNFAQVSTSLYRGCEPEPLGRKALCMMVSDITKDLLSVAAALPHIKPALRNLALDILIDLSGLLKPSPEPFAALKSMGIKTIINLRLFDFHDREALKGFGFHYLHIPFDPFHPSEKEVVDFLKVVTDPRYQPAFVHCEDGVDRTGFMCAVYRMAVQGWSAEKAISEMEKFKPHPVFVDLKNYLRNLDVEKIKAKVAAAPMPIVEIIPPRL